MPNRKHVFLLQHKFTTFNSHNSTEHHASKESPWISLPNANCISGNILPQQWIFFVEWRHRSRPVQYSIGKAQFLKGKPEFTTCKPRKKFTKFGIILCSEGCLTGLWPYKLENRLANRDNLQKQAQNTCFAYVLNSYKNFWLKTLLWLSLYFYTNNLHITWITFLQGIQWA